MIKRLYLVVFISLLAAPVLLAQDSESNNSQSASIAGAWQISWQGRGGSQQAAMQVQQDGSKLSGTFQDESGSSQLTGSIAGNKVSFSVQIQGRPMTVAFTGTVDGDKMSGTLQPQGGGGGGGGRGGTRGWTGESSLDRGSPIGQLRGVIRHKHALRRHADAVSTGCLQFILLTDWKKGKRCAFWTANYGNLNAVQRSMDESQNAPRSRDWRLLAERASNEMDPDKLMSLVAELNRVLDELASTHSSRSEGSRE